MSLVDVKTAFDALPLSDESKKIAQGIVEAALARGGMTGEEREKLLQLLEIEEELANIEVSAGEEVLKALNDLENEVVTVLEKAATELEEVGKE